MFACEERGSRTILSIAATYSATKYDIAIHLTGITEPPVQTAYRRSTAAFGVSTSPWAHPDP
jgi:hypothetical protein